jgi:hypothetical protein
MTLEFHGALFCTMLLVAACSDSATGEPTRAGAGTSNTGGTTTSVGGDTASTPPAATSLPPGNLASGKALVDQNACSLCHYADYGGAGFNPNITPDERFGIGKWTDAQVEGAIRRSLSSDGASLCALMVRFPFSDQEVSDVITFLRSLPAVTRANSNACPGHGKAM